MSTRHVLLFILVLTWTCFCIFLFNPSVKINKDLEIYKYFNTDTKYLIDTPNCRIENLDPFNEEIKPFHWKKDGYSCSKFPLLSYIERNEHQVTLRINQTLLSTYSYFNLTCCYSEIYRINSGEKPDETLSFSACIPFDYEVKVTHNIIQVECRNILRVVYKNIHYIIKKPDEPNETSTNKLSILMLGIDGVSKLNFLRTMPKTYSLCESNGWIPLNGYNKIEENTYPNLMAFLTGRSYQDAYNTCSPFEIGKMDTCNYIWHDFKLFNYTTAFGEDSEMSTFNYLKVGFLHEPTDVYLKPYVTATLRLPTSRYCNNDYCTGPENSGERILNVAKDFSTVLKNYPTFGLFWMNTYSHDDINCAATLDDTMVDTLNHLEDNGVLNNTIVVLLSDHGFRYGKIRITHTGYMEERLPLFYIWLPYQFKTKYPTEYKTIIANSRTLTSPYDLYMTFQHLLQMESNNYKEKSSLACPKCSSLFKPIAKDRTCDDAGIPLKYCTCTKYYHMDVNRPIVQGIAEFVLNQLNAVIDSFGESARYCWYFILDTVLNVKSLIIKPGVEENILIKIKTFPDSTFEANVNVKYENNGPVLGLNDKISRISRYGPRSYCVKDSSVQYYCYCKSFFDTVTRVLCNNKFCFV